MKRRTLLNITILCFSLWVALFATGCGQSSLPVQTSASAPAPAPLAVTVSPDSLFIKRGNNWNFTAAVAYTNDQRVTWTIQEGSTGGTISDTGVYTAPATMGVYHIVATSKADPSKSAMATDGTVLIAGGSIEGPGPSPGTYSSIPVADSEIYNPATGSFSPGPTMRSARYSHTATLMPDGSVLLAGGCCSTSSNAANGSAEVYQ